MIAFAEHLATRPHVVAACRKAQLAVATWLAIVTNDILDCDAFTGRGMRTSEVVAGERVGRSPKTVSKARTVAHRVGLALPLYGARELGEMERLTLYAEHPGHQQRGFPMEWVYTLIPSHRRARIAYPKPGRWAVVRPAHHEIGHLPTFGGLCRKDLREWYISSAAGAAKTVPPPAARRQRRRPGLQLAHQVLSEPYLRDLLPIGQPGSAASLFAPWERSGWSSSSLIDALCSEAANRGLVRGVTFSGHGMLKSLLSAIDPYANGPLIPASTDESEACTFAGCDGHGWLEAVVGADGYLSVAPCPTCRPGARSRSH